MPDLHGWITQQIDRVELGARRATADLGTVLNQIDYQDDAVTADEQHIMDHRPAAVLRRCDADRRILARHHLDPGNHYEPACHGCGTYGYADLANVDNLNECPELLDLAHAHGVTPEILAILDQPETPARPERSDGGRGFLMPDAINASLASFWTGTVARTPLREVPAALRGPNWKP